MKKRTAPFAVLSVLCLCAFPASSHADTVFTNLASGYSDVHGLNVFDVENFGPGSETNAEVASSFTVAAGSGYDLTQIDSCIQPALSIA